MLNKITAKIITVMAAIIAGISPAFAHHPLGGEAPQTIANGLLSGVGHPIIGFDHLGTRILCFELYQVSSHLQVCLLTCLPYGLLAHFRELISDKDLAKYDELTAKYLKKPEEAPPSAPPTATPTTKLPGESSKEEPAKEKGN